MKISDILRHKSGSGASAVVTIGADETVPALLGALAERNIGAVVVVGGDGRDQVQGIVSERDVVRHLARHGGGTLDHRVADLMTADVHTCSSGDSVDAIAETMTTRRIRHLPVVDGGRLVGIVSIGDVVSSRIRQLEHDRSQLEQYIAG